MNIEQIISVIGLLGAGGVIGAYFNHLFEKRREIELHFRQRKEEQYKKFLEYLIGFFEGWEGPKRKKEFMRELYTHAPLYASSDVIKLANKFLKCFSGGKKHPRGGKSDRIYKKLVLEIRKDLSGPDLLQSLQFWKKKRDDLLEKDINIMRFNP